MKTCVNNKKRMQSQLPGEAMLTASNSLLGAMAVRTQEEVAKMMGVSRQNVQQAERNALWKLRNGLRSLYRELNS